MLQETVLPEEETGLKKTSDPRTAAFNVNLDDAAQGVMALVNTIEDWSPGKQVMSPAIFFLLIAERTGIRPSELMDAVNQLIHDTDRRRRPEIKAAALYLKHEV